MTEMRNKLPVGIHLDSGGCARQRSGGTTIDMDAQTSGSFQAGSATRIRIQGCYRGSGDIVVLIRYGAAASPETADFVLRDGCDLMDSIPPGTTVYWVVCSATMMIAQEAISGDRLYVTFYE